MEKNRPLIVSVTGWSGSGKTTFCEKLISELTSRGYRTAAVKNTHLNLKIDKPGSDSDRFFKAGAESVCLNTAGSMVVFSHNRLDSGDMLSGLFSDADIIIAEGFRAGECVRLEVTGVCGTTAEMKNSCADTDIIVYGSESLAEEIKAAENISPRPVLIHRDDIKTAATIICDRRT